MDETIITKILARQILDSRGNPTVEAEVFITGGQRGRAAVPSGASTGVGEACELRDNNPKEWGGKGVSKAVSNVVEIIQPALIGLDAADQTLIDDTLIKLDGTDNKSNLGANAVLAVSLAAAKAAAKSRGRPFYSYLAKMTKTETKSIPLPMMNIVNGGAHANFSTDIQEFMIIAKKAKTIVEALQIGTEVFHALAVILKQKGYQTTVGDEGGYAPLVKNGNRESLELIIEAIKLAGYAPGEDIALALDVAASELFEDGKYHLKSEGKTFSSTEMTEWLKSLVNDFPIISIEDGLDEADWDEWVNFTTQMGDKLQIVGDDLLVTNTTLLKKAIVKKAANSILIKPNQIGTLTETIKAVKIAQAAGWKTVMSHRSGETEDTTIAHLAVGLNTQQIKTGSLSRTDRVAKYNELIRIAENPNLKLASPFSD